MAQTALAAAADWRDITSFHAIRDVTTRAAKGTSAVGEKFFFHQSIWRLHMSFGKGALLWLIGIPLPIILLLALFWR
jgi:hypothetical protein